ncbi:fungal specific transcription factor domain-containing protein [Aspergillus mulundensis]|uniref:Xylanolytic transcriptional activator regulatory domain-containing protein n=1 Tax=Aspergillus mulundensis TaxID=1810919 RepID=A0A3D8SKZ3_9EURO|nr:hypothetical protein DSM5745_03647 [Aspergillus mulundensis]RDW87005.1 hypothetical protein DSM5745_03647 [Aspergillus mulundensis]
MSSSAVTTRKRRCHSEPPTLYHEDLDGDRGLLRKDGEDGQPESKRPRLEALPCTEGTTGPGAVDDWLLEAAGLLKNLRKAGTTAPAGSDDDSGPSDAERIAAPMARELTTDKSVVRLQTEIDFLQAKSKQQLAPFPQSTYMAARGSGCHHAHEYLKHILPPKAVCDHLLTVYAATFERIYRVLHMPTFRRLYEEFWSCQMPTDCQPPPAPMARFLPQLAAVLAIASMLASQAYRETHAAILAGFDAFVIPSLRMWRIHATRNRAGGQESEFAAIQTRTLLLLAETLRCDAPAKLHSDSMMLLYQAMNSNLPRAPCTSPNLSAFEAEMRRRVWVTIVALDLQASVLSSMPLNTPAFDLGPFCPPMIDDSDFDEHCAELPSETTNWAPAAFEAAMLSHFSDQFRAIERVADFEEQQQLQSLVDARTCGVNLKRRIDQIPASFKADDPVPHESLPSLPRLLHTLHIRRPVVRVFRAIMASAHASSIERESAAMTLLDSSMSVLQLPGWFDQVSGSGCDAGMAPSRHSETIYRVCRRDIVNAALDLCACKEHLHYCSSDVSDKFGDVLESVEGALDGLCRTLDNPTRPGDMDDIVHVAVALHLARSGNPEKVTKEVVRPAVIKALSSCRQRLVSSVLKRRTDSDSDVDRQPTPSSQASDETARQYGPDFARDDPALAAEFAGFVVKRLYD